MVAQCPVTLCSFLASNFRISDKTSDFLCTITDTDTVNIPLHHRENGWRGTFFLQLLLSLNVNIYLQNIQDTNKIFKQYGAGCCSLHKAKYSDVFSCLSVARDGFKNTPREKYFSLCPRPNVQSRGSTLGALVKVALGHTFCHHLSNSSSSLASCKEPTGQRAAWLNEFLWEY